MSNVPLDPMVEDVLDRYLERVFGDPDKGYISSEDVKNTFRELYQRAINLAISYVNSSSAYGSYVRHVEDARTWDELQVEAAGRSLPSGVMAIIDPGVIAASQKVLVWTGTDWMDMVSVGGLPANVAKVVISATPPPPSSELMWLDTSSNKVPYPFKVWDGAQNKWLEITQKGEPGETLSPEGFVDWGSDLPDPPIYVSGPNIGQPKPLAVYTTIRDKHLWVYDPSNLSATPGPATPPVFDANGNVVSPAIPPAGWLDMGIIEGPPGPQGPPGSFRAYDPIERYHVGDVVAFETPGVGVHLYMANVDVPQGRPHVSPDWTKFAEPPHNQIHISSRPNDTPMVSPPATAIVGDMFLNDFDEKAWVYSEDPTQGGAYIWKQLATDQANRVIIKTQTGDNPNTAPPTGALIVGDIYLNVTDGVSWVYSEILAGKFDWQILVAPPPGAVAVTNVAGQTPAQVWPPANIPSIGDMVINTADNISWVWAGGAWVEIAAKQSAVTITVLTTAGQTPVTHPPSNPNAGDILTNTADRVTWEFNGTGWQQIVYRRDAEVTVLTTTGEDPTTNAPTDPESGDVVVNTADSLAWIYDGTNWLSLASATQVTTSSVAGETPAAPGTAVIPTPRAGDMFLNTADELAWLYDGAQWRELSAERPAVTELTVSGDTPATVTSVPPITYGDGAKRDDVIVNTTDQKTWIFDGTAWIIAAEPPDKARGTVTYITDVTPAAPFDAVNNWGFGAGNVEPDPTVVEPEPGDVWINHVLAEVGVFQ